MTSLSEEANHRDSAAPRRPPRTATWIAVVAVAVSVILGAWIVYDLTTEPQVPSEVGAAIDQWFDAYDNQDAEAILPVVAEDFTLLYNVYELNVLTGETTLTEVISDDIEGVVAIGFTFEWDNEVAGDPVTTGEGPWIVARPENWFWNNQIYSGIATYVVVEEGGVAKVKAYTGDFELTYDTSR